jgi:DNA-binding response OmpR family regulator
MVDTIDHPTGAPLVVLVVEDEALIHELIGSALEDGGFAVLAAANGNEALGLLEEDKTPIRALVTDIDLGTKTTGWDVAKRARELHPEIPVVYITGGSADEWSANGVPNSVLITKPFAPVQIVTAVSNLLNGASPPTS